MAFPLISLAIVAQSDYKRRRAASVAAYVIDASPDRWLAKIRLRKLVLARTRRSRQWSLNHGGLLSLVPSGGNISTTLPDSYAGKPHRSTRICLLWAAFSHLSPEIGVLNAAPRRRQRRLRAVHGVRMHTQRSWRGSAAHCVSYGVGSKFGLLRALATRKSGGWNIARAAHAMRTLGWPRYWSTLPRIRSGGLRFHSD